MTIWVPWRSPLLALCVLISSCAGVITMPVYSVSSPAEWKAVNGSGNPFVLETPTHTVEASLLGVWGHDWTSTSRITLRLETRPDVAVSRIKKASLLLDGTTILTPERRWFVHTKGVQALHFAFANPSLYPKDIEVRIQSLPPLRLEVGTEECVFYGESSFSLEYAGCTEAAKSVGPPGYSF